MRLRPHIPDSRRSEKPMIYLGSISEDTQGQPITIVLAEDEERELLPGECYPI
jgi:hypothetical protein